MELIPLIFVPNLILLLASGPALALWGGRALARHRLPEILVLTQVILSVELLTGFLEVSWGLQRLFVLAAAIGLGLLVETVIRKRSRDEPTLDLIFSAVVLLGLNSLLLSVFPNLGSRHANALLGDPTLVSGGMALIFSATAVFWLMPRLARWRRDLRDLFLENFRPQIDAPRISTGRLMDLLLLTLAVTELGVFWTLVMAVVPVWFSRKLQTHRAYLLGTMMLAGPVAAVGFLVSLHLEAWPSVLVMLFAVLIGGLVLKR